MNQREKEEYLRDYSLLKSAGKPFFPYAVAKDSVMACVVMLVIITLSLVLGVAQGSKVNPTTTTYVPRPGLVLLLPLRAPARDQAAEPRRARDGGHPDDRDDPAVPAALLRSRARAPAGAAADRHGDLHLRCRRDGAPDLRGRDGGTPDGARTSRCRRRSRSRGLRRSTSSKKAGSRSPQSGCEDCHDVAGNGNNGPGPELTHIGSRIPPQAIARTLANPTAPMPSFKSLPPQKFEAIVYFLSQLK